MVAGSGGSLVYTLDYYLTYKKRVTSFGYHSFDSSDLLEGCRSQVTAWDILKINIVMQLYRNKSHLQEEI